MRITTILKEGFIFVLLTIVVIFLLMIFATANDILRLF